MNVWSFLLAIGGITGLWLAGKGKKEGWLFGLAMQVAWAVYSIASKQYGFLLSCLGYGWVYARNYRRAKNGDNL